MEANFTKVRKCAAVGTALLFSLSVPTVAYGGEINADEQRILTAAENIFTYDGRKYQASGEIISQLKSYLSQDGVDLTAEEADTAVSAFYENVAAGVELGYMEPVSDAVGGNRAAQEKNGATGEAVWNVLTGSGPLNETGQKDTLEKAGDRDSLQDNQNTAAGEIEGEDGTGAPDAGDVQAEKNCSVKETAGRIKVYDDNGKTVFQSEPIIKNTGYKSSDRMRMLFAALFAGFLTAGICMIKAKPHDKQKKGRHNGA